MKLRSERDGEELKEKAEKKRTRLFRFFSGNQEGREKEDESLS